jgi:hypothetical protein
MKTHGGVELTILTSSLDEGEWSASRPGRFTPGERAPSTHWIGGRMGRSGLCGVETNILTVPGIEPRPSSSYPVAVPTELSGLLLKKLQLVKTSQHGWSQPLSEGCRNVGRWNPSLEHTY